MTPKWSPLSHFSNWNAYAFLTSARSTKPSTISCSLMWSPWQFVLICGFINNEVPHRHFIHRPVSYSFLCCNNNNNNNNNDDDDDDNNIKTTTVSIQQKRWHNITESADGAGDFNGISVSYMSTTVKWEHGNWKQANRRLNIFWLQPYASGSAFGLTDFMTLHRVAFIMNGAIRIDRRAPHMYSEGT